MTELNHRKLCEIGARFLKRPESANGHGCHFAIVEPACYGENPDVFGIRHGVNTLTFLLEAKMSRSDFLADKKKPHRMNPETGIGKYRYFICPNGLIKPEELPEKWGLIYVSPKGICKVIAGILAAPKIKYYCEWSKTNKSHIDHKAVEENFKTLAFNERNFQNEMNLLTMALARLADAEEILYMQRNYLALKQKNADLTHEIHQMNRSLKLAEFNSLRGAP
ncbi:adenylosuccinate synthase, partial [Acinetobacter sp. CFCC 10889]|uniref:adenylosuccinate synthase n=1 Tax=Acinetobacter sp. CFCC 10889 TaxID=1775557 RepID=UPI001D18C15F